MTTKATQLFDRLSIFGGLLLLTLGYRIAFGEGIATEGLCAVKSRDGLQIVLDVGHSAKQPGAISARGVTEYHFNLKLAHRIEDELILAGFRSTRLMVTRATGAAGLWQRATRANQMQADLFLSIHHDSVQPKYLKSWWYQGKNQFFSDEFHGFSIFVSQVNTSYAGSLRFATMLAYALLASGMNFT